MIKNILRKCIKCGLEANEEKDLFLFVKSSNSTHGRWNKCKQCNSKYQIEKRRRLQDEVDKFRDVPCVDCGIKYPPVCMDFDHVRGEKFKTISQMVRNQSKVNMEKIMEEIEKCEVVCANCHRIRTWRSDRKYPNTGSKGL